MALRDELGYPNPIETKSHEAVLNILMTATMMTKEGDRILRPYGLTASQFNVLMLVKYQSKEGVLNQTQLGDMLLVNRSNVTGLVDRLESAGLLKRVSGKEDRRENRISLTAEGKRILQEAEEAYFTRIDSIVKTLSAGDARSLCLMLERIRSKIGKTS